MIIFFLFYRCHLVHGEIFKTHRERERERPSDDSIVAIQVIFLNFLKYIFSFFFERKFINIAPFFFLLLFFWNDYFDWFGLGRRAMTWIYKTARHRERITSLIRRRKLMKRYTPKVLFSTILHRRDEDLIELLHARSLCTLVMYLDVHIYTGIFWKRLEGIFSFFSILWKWSYIDVRALDSFFSFISRVFLFYKYFGDGWDTATRLLNATGKLDKLSTALSTTSSNNNKTVWWLTSRLHTRRTTKTKHKR